MNQLKSWKFLFGVAVVITVGLASMLLFRVNNDRSKLQVITEKLVQSVEIAQDNNQNVQKAIDSLTDHLSELNSTVEILEAQKDSLVKGIPRSNRKLSPEDSKANLVEADKVLYMNCLNTVNLNIPASYKNKDLSFTAKGADISKTNVLGRVEVVPKELIVEINISSAGKVISTESYQVKPMPKPRFVARDNSMNEINLKIGVKAAFVKSLTVTAEMEETFKFACPKDALYKINKMEVVWTRGTASLGRLQLTANDKGIIAADLSSWSLRKDDRIIIDIKKVSRKTYSGAEVQIDIVGSVLTFPINSNIDVTESPVPAKTPTSGTPGVIKQPPVSEPTFSVLDSNGLVIDTNASVKGGVLRGIRVLAGSPFRVREMEILLSRGSSRVATLKAKNDTPDITAWRNLYAPGDRLTITIKRVVKSTPNGDREAAFKNGVIIITIL